MAFQCVTNCCNFVIISRIEYSFLSQQSTISVLKRAGFLSPNRLSELVWDSESEEAGASSDCIIYLGNGIVCIFRQPLKYLRFSYSFLDVVRKYHIRILDSPLCKNVQKTTTHVGILEQNSTNAGLSWFMTVSRVISGVKRKVCSEVLRKCDVCGVSVCVCVVR